MSDTGSTDSRNPKSTATTTASQQKDAKAVSNLVKQKLELYINYEKRENKFDPRGSCQTTRKMHGVDLAYRVLEISKLEKKHKQTKKGCTSAKGDKASTNKSQKENKKGKEVQQRRDSHEEKECSRKDQDKNGKQETSHHKHDKKEKRAIEPKLEKNSLKVTLHSEAERLANYANEVWETYPISDLAVIHRFRPNSPAVRKSARVGHVQNYSRHVGSALHQKAYVSYYVEQGLDSGVSKKNKRLQNLTPVNRNLYSGPHNFRSEKGKDSKDQQKEAKKSTSAIESRNTRGSGEKETSKTKDPHKDEQGIKTGERKAGGGGGKRETNWPINQHLLSDDHKSTDNESEFNYSDDFHEAESRPSTREDVKNSTEEHEYSKTDVAPDSASYADDFDSDNQSEAGKEDGKDTKEEAISAAYTSCDEDKHRSASPSKQSDHSGSQVSVVESDEEINQHYKSRKTRDDRISFKSEDAVSVQTYASVEHAVERPLRLC